MADSSFGLKIGLEGEREFKRAIATIGRGFMDALSDGVDYNARMEQSTTSSPRCWAIKPKPKN